MNDFTPGDVALVSSWRGTDLLGVRVLPRIPADPITWCVYECGDTRGLSDDEVTSARALVVIDPEDTEAVLRLIGLYYEHVSGPHSESTDYSDLAERLQAALREFAAPKPAKRVWTDGDVVQHKSDHYTAQRMRGGEWRTTSQTAGFDAWGDDNFVTGLVKAGSLVVLREQAAEVPS